MAVKRVLNYHLGSIMSEIRSKHRDTRFDVRFPIKDKSQSQRNNKSIIKAVRQSSGGNTNNIGSLPSTPSIGSCTKTPTIGLSHGSKSVPSVSTKVKKGMPVSIIAETLDQSLCLTLPTQRYANEQILTREISKATVVQKDVT